MSKSKPLLLQKSFVKTRSRRTNPSGASFMVPDASPAESREMAEMLRADLSPAHRDSLPVPDVSDRITAST